MKVVLINSVCGIRSTGRICSETAGMLKARGDDCLVFFGRVKAGAGCEEFACKFGNIVTNVFHYFTRMLFDDDGKGSYFVTKRMIRKIKAYDPDVIHIHNLHGHYIHYGLLMDFLAESGIPTVFSFYDCWMFTGNCTHFDYIGCNKWETMCEDCPNQSKYIFDKYWLDASKKNYISKRAAMERIKNKYITPGSYWMEGLVRRSFLKDCDIRTVQSGVDLGKFKPNYTDIRQEYDLKDKHIVLCVASNWTKEKGIDYLPKLADELPDGYKIVVVGNIKSKNFTLPEGVIHIPQTNSLEELTAWYTAADVYVNLTLQETLGLTNIEALACGTPVVTFNSGGSPECVDETCGIVVARGDIQGAARAVENIVTNNLFSSQACCDRAQRFDKNLCYLKYIELYDEIKRK